MLLAEKPDSLYPGMTVNVIRKQKISPWLITLAITWMGCSTEETRPSPEVVKEEVVKEEVAKKDVAKEEAVKKEDSKTTKPETIAPSPPLVETDQKIYALLNGIQNHIQNLETKITSLDTKLESKLDPRLRNLAATSKGILHHPSENLGTLAKPLPALHDPEAGFVNDNAVQNFRKAMILFQGQKYPESVLAFSSFLEQVPDHPLAGSAQFYIGQAYMKQKEFKLALKEFQRVLTSYDRSTHVADTLKEMATAEESLKLQADAHKHRQLLSSLFPQSPAASSQIPSSTEKETETEPKTEPASTSLPPSAVEIPPTVPLMNHENIEVKP